MMTSQHSSRLGNCEVCDANLAKYTCPQCEVKTCSLPCVNIHKKELPCDGQRNRVKYIPLKKFSSMDLQNDYILLEETGRTIKRICTEGKLLGESKRNFLRMVKLKRAARDRGIKLEFLPHKFTRHRENTTFLNWKTGELFWKVQWVFPEADNYTVSDPKVLDICTLSNTLLKYIKSSEDPDYSVDHKKLALYQSAGKDGIHVLLKAEKITGNKFYMTDLENTISHNLRGKLILEHPIFYLILSKNFNNYEIESSVSEMVNQDKYIRAINENQNFLFSSINE